MLILRQSTAIDIRMGPFLDATDGVTPETGITLGAADQAEVLKEDGAATVTMAGTFAAITGCDGWYDYTAATGDVDTVGEIVFVVQDSSVSLPVFVRGFVVEQAVYDALYATNSAGPIQSTVAGRTLDVTATGAAGIDWANVENPTTALDLSGTDIQLVDTTTTNTDMRGTDSALLAASINLTAGAVDNVTTVATTTTNTDMRGTDSAALASVATEARLAELDAANLPTTTDDILTDTGTTIPATITTLQADTDDIQTRLPAALVGGAMDSDVSNMQADTVNASALATDAVDEIRDAIMPTQNVAFDNIEFLFVAASDNVTPVTGATGTAVTRSIDGGGFGAGTGTLAEVANGIYQYDASAADMNGGIITFRFTGTGGTPGAPDDRFLTIVTGGGV